VFYLTSNITIGDPGPVAPPPSFAFRVTATPEMQAAQRGHGLFNVPPHDRLVLEITAQPWARDDRFPRFEAWVTPEGGEKRYIGGIEYIVK
jgi:hypothetical protein